jgi:hypothetical protein
VTIHHIKIVGETSRTSQGHEIIHHRVYINGEFTPEVISAAVYTSLDRSPIVHLGIDCPVVEVDAPFTQVTTAPEKRVLLARSAYDALCEIFRLATDVAESAQPSVEQRAALLQAVRQTAALDDSNQPMLPPPTIPEEHAEL